MKKSLTPLLLSILIFSGCTTVVSGVFMKNHLDDGQKENPPARANRIEEKNASANGQPDHTGSASSDPPAFQKSSPSTEKPDSHLTLVVSGDAMSHENSWRSALKEDGTFDYMPQYENIEELLNRGDLTLVNLETPVSGEEYGYRGFPKFNAPINLAETLKKVGVDMVITANNHTLDNGLGGLKNFLDNLDHTGLLHTGAARSPEEAAAPYLLEINGIQTGFAASTAKLKMEVPVEYAVPLIREKVIRQQILALREAGAELIVYHIHWGKEYTQYPSQYQMDLYRILEEEGVDIVIGSHPHRLQPMEIRSIDYQGQKKNQAVIWSTANLSWGGTQRYDYVNTGAVFQIHVERKGGVVTVRDMDYDLVYNLNTKTVDGVKYIELIKESDMEFYRESHPQEYLKMLGEFQWAHDILNQTVDVQYTIKQ